MNKYPFIVDIPADEYHEAARRGEFLSSHLLGDFRACPLLFHKKMTGEIETTDSSAYKEGRAIHTLILEGRAAFDEEYIVSDGPVNPKTGECFGRLTKAYKEWAAAQDKTVIPGSDFNWMTKMQRSVWLHPLASELLGDGRPEGVVRTQYRGEPCQIRMDWFNPDVGGKPVIVDLKSTDNLSFFERDARKYGYPEQLAFYREVFRAAENNPDAPIPEVFIIAVEKREPYRCGVWKLTDELLDQSAAGNATAISFLKECRCQNTWPTGFEDVRLLDIL